MHKLHFILPLFVLSLGTFIMAGCSSLYDFQAIDEQYLNGDGVRVDLLRDQHAIDVSNNAAHEQNVTHTSRSGNVEIYSLDGQQTQDYAAAPRVTPPVLRRSSVNQDAREAAFTPEAGLEIFPLDKTMNQALRLPK